MAACPDSVRKSALLLLHPSFLSDSYHLRALIFCHREWRRSNRRHEFAFSLSAGAVGLWIASGVPDLVDRGGESLFTLPLVCRSEKQTPGLVVKLSLSRLEKVSNGPG